MTGALPMNRQLGGQAARLPLGRLAPKLFAGETPAQAAGTAAPLVGQASSLPSGAKRTADVSTSSRWRARRAAGTPARGWAASGSAHHYAFEREIGSSDREPK